VTHVDVGGSDGRSAELLRACLEPAVTQRLGIILRVGRAAAPVGPPAATLATAIERDLARLGRRQVDTLVLESLDDEGAWELARAYRDAGVAARLGVVATDAEDLQRAARLEGLEWVEVAPEVLGDDPALTTLRGRGVVVAVDPGGNPPPSWCTVRLIAATDRSDLDAALLGVDALRGTSAG
jgi:aryl-alcohol dehydrogenase-like predicted oxidoreductase